MQYLVKMGTCQQSVRMSGKRRLAKAVRKGLCSFCGCKNKREDGLVSCRKHREKARKKRMEVKKCMNKY